MMKIAFKTSSLCVGAVLLTTGCAKLPAAPATSTSSSPKAGETKGIYGAWRVGKVGGGGYVQNVVFTSNPKILYTYADVMGPWRSDDGGQSWRALSATLPSSSSYGIRGLLVDPRDPNKIIIGRGGGQWWVADGIYNSNDGGKTWKKTLTADFIANEDLRASGFLLARNPQNADEILAAAGKDGIFRSLDNGQTWKNLGMENHYPSDLRFDSSNPKRLWLSTHAKKMWTTSAPGQSREIELKGGFFRSEDGGATWQKLLDKAPTEILQHPTDKRVLIGLFDSEGVKKSDDGGATWQNFSDGLIAQSGHWMDRVNALAAGPNFVLTATQRGEFYRLDNGQTKWQKIERQGVQEIYEGREWYGKITPGQWQHFGAALGSINVDPRDSKRWFFTDWYAIYESRDEGKNWRLSMDGIELTVLHTLTQDPTDAGVVHLGMGDNGYMLSEDGGDRFTTPKITSNMKAISLSAKLPSRVYAVGDGIGGQWSSNQVFVSVDRGKTWTKSPMQGLPDTKEFKCNSIVVAPNKPYTVYLAVSKDVAASKGGVYKSTDGGKAWEWMGQGLPTAGGQFFRDDIWGIGRELAVSPSGEMVAISRDRKVAYRFENNQWTQCLKLNSAPHSVVADVLQAGRFFIGSHDGVFRSNDGGKTWSRVLESAAEHVAVDAAKPNRVAAGTANGILWSSDAGATWKALDKALPYRYHNIPCFAGDRILAATAGSGTFWMPLTPQAALTIQAKPAKIATLPNASTQNVAITNGDMSQGTTEPTGWKVLWTGSGKIKAVRDTQTFKSAPASLRVENEGGAAYGNVGQSLTVSTTTFKLSGQVKAEGKLEEARVAVQAFDENFKQVAFVTLAETNGDWKSFSQEVTLPATARSAVLVVLLKGNGKIWIDDVQVSLTPQIFLSSNTP